MVDLIADIDAGLIALCAHARPGLLAVTLCWIKKRFWAIWHRVFLPELWGPYGPWGRIVRFIGRIATLVGRLIGRK